MNGPDIRVHVIPPPGYGKYIDNDDYQEYRQANNFFHLVIFKLRHKTEKVASRES
jgi:hypothetical protein